MAHVRLHQITKRFGSVTAVDRFSLDLIEGEVLALLGPSGCGKSTVLRLIAGFEEPNAGEIWIGERAIARNGHLVPPEARGVGMVFQDYALFPHLTVLQNAIFGLGNLSRKERRSRGLAYLDQVGLAGFAERYPYELSGGQQQRVALARAMAPEPSVLLLDEPFSHLDTALRHRMREEIRTILKGAGCTAIIVTHDQKDAFVAADRIAVMSDGRLLQVGTAKQVYTRPVDEFVAAFVGHSNLIRGTIDSAQGCIFTELGTVPCSFQIDGRDGEVTLCLSPRCLYLDPQGTLEGRIVSAAYEGGALEAIVATNVDGQERRLVVHVDPDQAVQAGDLVRLNLQPRDCAVVG